MVSEKIGLLHPGQMGISLAASAQQGGHDVYWVSAGRSAETRQRAASCGLQDAGTLAHLCATCELIVSVCPPHAAEAVAREVVAHGFEGVYVDANAISPQRVERMSQAMVAAGITFVDGGIIGGPAWKPGETWLYLSGPRAADAGACFDAGPLETTILGDAIGQASALKMCYAAYSKGTTALLSAVLAAAEQLQVREELEQCWTRDDVDFAPQTRERVRRVTAKAWRFAGEMDEIAATLHDAGLPAEFHQAAAEIYRRMAHFKTAPATPALDDVLTALLRPENSEDESGKM